MNCIKRYSESKLAWSNDSEQSEPSQAYVLRHRLLRSPTHFKVLRATRIVKALIFSASV
ncbi:hypothetical protein NG796_19755 [Laspinema sp. A4]|uniref:hypothetical protein n=1 Tax=Laspinema sp. D2d TaxID=2953686 RepID=UPI0021BB4721|nr:hypothetical protein [Laspinema sp. D2d]MCT7985513.1 hypothetical protein [Laspinema sp. D2d]